jgi:AAA+ superfamily predicted ATPase
VTNVPDELLTNTDAKPHDSLPNWYPAWARELADLYFSGTTCVFVLHGNVHDLIYCQNDKGEPRYCTINEFLAQQIFGKWDLVVGYDLSRGLRPLAGANAERLRSMVSFLTSRWGEPAGWPREPDKVLLALDLFTERNLVEVEAQRKSCAMIFDYAQYIVSAGDLDSLSRGNASRLVRFLAWAQNPHIKQQNMAYVLIVDKLSELSDRLIHSPHVATIEVPLPNKEDRDRFVTHATKDQDLAKLTDFSQQQLVELSNGLNLTSLDVVLAQAAKSGRRLDAARYKELKKDLLERQCQGLIEFVEPKHTLELVIGADAAVERLRQDAAAIQNGNADIAPMGYLVCGPVGTGKTWLAECFAGSIGIPCVVLKNFRSKYVGETEGNLETVLGVLRSLGPVLVIIDEADAALGNRSSSGDSGTSSRVFSMIASQMGNTKYRGKIIWMLLTSRPDLLPIDLKRQGRAEVHIPLLYPHEPESIRKMFLAMAKKYKLKLDDSKVPEIPKDRRLSGADIESILLTAKRAVITSGRQEVEKADLEVALAEFIPSAQGLEKELQELAAVLECTQLSFLSPDWQTRVKAPNGRSQLQERMVAIRQLIEQGD